METGERWTIGEDNDVFVVGTGDCVAKVCGAPEGIKKSKGRAQLIAAAPDLLAACELAADFFHESSDAEICTEENLCVYCAAIAKATGVTP